MEKHCHSILECLLRKRLLNLRKDLCEKLENPKKLTLEPSETMKKNDSYNGSYDEFWDCVLGIALKLSIDNKSQCFHKKARMHFEKI